MERRKAWPAGLTANGPRFIGLIVLALVIFGPGIVYLLRLTVRRHTMEHRLRQLEAIQQDLIAEQKRLTSDAVYVEGLIRSTFKLAKPGELVVPLESDEPTKAR